MTVQEYLDNRQKYIEQGRAIESNVAQQDAREKAFVDKVDELQDAGLSLKEVEEQTQKWLDTQAALHNSGIPSYFLMPGLWFICRKWNGSRIR